MVRHAMPVPSPDIPPHAWPLSDDGASRARDLLARLPPDARRVSSTELKARQTAGEAATDARFDEVGRVEPWEGDYRELRLAYVNGVDHPGWEPRSSVAGRFDEGLRWHLERAGGRPLVVVTHGMAMTVWLTAHAGLDTPGAFWSGLGFPDVHVVGAGHGLRGLTRPDS